MHVATIVEGAKFELIMSTLLLFNVFLVAYESKLRNECRDQNEYKCDVPRLLKVCDMCLLSFYTCELSLSFFAYREYFFKSTWNILDLIVVVTGLADIILTESVIPKLSFLHMLHIPRLVRVFRLLCACTRVLKSIYAALNVLFACVRSSPSRDASGNEFFACERNAPILRNRPDSKIATSGPPTSSFQPTLGADEGWTILSQDAQVSFRKLFSGWTRTTLRRMIGGLYLCKRLSVCQNVGNDDSHGNTGQELIMTASADI